MAPSKLEPKKEKVFHPSSRKAKQLARNALRKDRLGHTSTRRAHKHDALVDVYGFFFHAIPEQGTLALADLHTLVRDLWLTRHNEELERERTVRRKGRPKSTKETELEDTKLREAEEYRTGLEIIDLTHPVNVQLFRQWDQKELAYAQQLRHVRIFNEQPEILVLSRPGKHQLLANDAQNEAEGTSMDSAAFESMA